MSRKKPRHSRTNNTITADWHNEEEEVNDDPVVSEDDAINENSSPQHNDNAFFLHNDVEFLSDSENSVKEQGDGVENVNDDTLQLASREIKNAQQNLTSAPVQVVPNVMGSGEVGYDAEVSDSSSEGDENPVGDIPMRWYEGFDHIGYNRDGQRILPANKPSALELAADPHAWRRIYDEKNDRQLVLTHDELRAIARIRSGRFPTASADPHFDEPIAWSGDVEKHPLTSGPEPKHRFLPSRHEARAVMKIVRAVREGKLKLPSERVQEQFEDELKRYNYDIWKMHEPKHAEDLSKSERARELMRVPAPKVTLPKHDESYNPPPEYLPTKNQVKKWKAKDPEDRKVNYLPKSYDSLRHVPQYENFIKERFERCLDLYLAVRIRRQPDRVNPEDLVPKLPSPRDLRPFPSDKSLSFGPLPARARSIHVHPRGQLLISGSDDGAVRVWEVATGALRYTWWFGSHMPSVDGHVQPISCVSWCPMDAAYIFAASIGNAVFIVSAAECLGLSSVESHALFEMPSEDSTRSSSLPEGITWTEGLDFIKQGRGENQDGREALDKKAVEKILRIENARSVRTVTWHHKGDYFATIGKDSTGCSVAIHRLSRRSSQMPFRRKTATVQSVRFHPSRPFFFVATMHNIRVYNLSAQEAIKTLKPGVKWISSMEIHPSGDHVLIGSYDKRLCWFDLDLSVFPYKTIRNHEYAVRVAKFHPSLPLFADAADDGSAHVFHGMVYDDLSRNPLIVPLKKLENYHKVTDSLGILDIAWHPRLPWLFTSGADRGLHLFSDMS